MLATIIFHAFIVRKHRARLQDFGYGTLTYIQAYVPERENFMIIRLLFVLAFISACSAGGQDVSKTIDLTAARLAEIQGKPYTAGNGVGGFSAAALSGYGENPGPDAIVFTGVGPYLHEMGFTASMSITAINGKGVNEIFADRWKGLRLQAPDGFDAAHYKDLIEYLFAEERGDSVIINIDVKPTTADLVAGNNKEGQEVWRINFP